MQIKPARCPTCKCTVTTININGTERYVVLPHMADGSKVVWGKTCGFEKKRK